MRRRPVTPLAPLVRRVIKIAGAALLAVWALWLVTPDLEPGHDFRAVGHVHLEGPDGPIETEADVFADLKEGITKVAVTEVAPHIRVATLEARRARRAFPGAPPAIPHEVDAALDGTQDCLPCHAYGGFNPQRVSYAPRTPHRERTGCMQCHVAGRTTGLFVPTDWETAAWPALSTTYQEGAPPTIPHELEGRGRCLACHGGAAAAPEIRTGHPERVSCLQCHLREVDLDATFRRPAGEEVI